MSHELAYYHQRSPDMVIPGCRNTGQEDTDGVVFPGVEPLEGTACFVGRQSILEAAAELHGISVREAKKRLETPSKPDKPQVTEIS